ncbi:MAG: alpha-galactosidase [Lachnospiraceae bacterium]|nr:alpha-galactosidase [Lachnospiraceae bacterium]
MPVIVHEKTGIFHLTNEGVSYIIRVMENKQLENLYYGKKIRDREDFSHLHEEGERSQMSICMPEPSRLSMQFTRQEYPCYGTGDYRSPALTARQENGSRIVSFTYDSYRLSAGKPRLAGLPATYVEKPSEAETLEITLSDKLMGTELILSYTIFAGLPVIARHARFRQKGEESVVLERAMSASVEFPDMEYELVQLSGAWARERHVRVRRLDMGLQGIQGLAGTAGGAEQNPFIALKRPDATEFSGEVYGFSLVYSGNFLANVEVSPFEMTRAMIGISPENFAWKLAPGECFTTPEAVLVYSDAGLNGMSQAFHKLYGRRLARGKWRDEPRPILLNNWEGTYFDFTEEKLLEMAREAKDAGVELFVLDDGWFGARNSDWAGLGDWYCNLSKIPSGIGGLSRKIEDMGLKFGLWVELEMVNPDSDLFRAHPDWAIHVPGRFRSHARHQYVLDFSRPEVVDYIYEMAAKLLSEARISYIKWDMNRYMTEPFSPGLPADRQGEMMHRYILGLYSLYERLIAAFPDVLFESCASGGARFDPGMLYYAPQAWCSDDTDASERVGIQYGTTFVYPLSMIGSHVSAAPNHQLLRSTPLRTRGAVAFFGTFGYELVLGKMKPEELAVVKEQVAFMKKYRRLIQIEGTFTRLLSPFGRNEAAWIVVSGDKSEALGFYFQRLNRVNGSFVRFRLAGLDPDRLYTVSHENGGERKAYKAYGDELMNAGIPLDRSEFYAAGGDFAALIFELKALF